MINCYLKSQEAEDIFNIIGVNPIPMENRRAL